MTVHTWRTIGRTVVAGAFIFTFGGGFWLGAPIGISVSLLAGLALVLGTEEGQK